MSIQLSPKKENDRAKKLREFFNAEHSSKDLTPEQVKQILNCTPEDAINEAIEVYATEVADDMWNMFLSNASYMFEQYEKSLAKAHKGCKIVANSEEIGYMKTIIRLMQDNGAKASCRTHSYMDCMSIIVQFKFNKQVSFDDTELLSEMFRRSDVTVCGSEKDESLIIKCEFFNIGTYIKEG